MRFIPFNSQFFAFLLRRCGLKGGRFSVSHWLPLLVLPASTMVHALVYEGVNQTGQPVLISYENTGVAQISMAVSRAVPVAVKETWRADPILNGFSLTAPNDSSLKKAGVRVEYERVNRSPTLLSCKAGCGPSVPYLIAVKR
jgi:hypothetical protein